MISQCICCHVFLTHRQATLDVFFGNKVVRDKHRVQLSPWRTGLFLLCVCVPRNVMAGSYWPIFTVVCFCLGHGYTNYISLTMHQRSFSTSSLTLVTFILVTREAVFYQIGENCADLECLRKMWECSAGVCNHECKLETFGIFKNISIGFYPQGLLSCWCPCGW